jgi:hypothetical protein
LASEQGLCSMVLGRCDVKLLIRVFNVVLLIVKDEISVCPHNKVYLLYKTTYFDQGHAVVRLMHCTTSRKVEGSIPDGVTGIFY